MNNLAHSGAIEPTGREETEAVAPDTKEGFLVVESDDRSGSSSSPNTEVSSEVGSIGGLSPVNASVEGTKKSARKLVEEEMRAVGRIGLPVWETYIKACGGVPYWLIFAFLFLLAAVSPVAENGWLRYVYHASSSPGVKETCVVTGQELPWVIVNHGVRCTISEFTQRWASVSSSKQSV
jgi:hypothetical protein